MSIDVHMFWAYGNFSRLETICANSFIKKGYNLNIWTYGKTLSISGATVRDASEILSEDRVYLNKYNSYASFACLFRYCLLCKLGGLWVDTDVAVLKDPEQLPTNKFLVTERTQENGLIINNNVIFNPEPMPGNIVDLARIYSDAVPKEGIEWGAIGPKLLTAFVNLNPNHGFDILPPEFANNFNWWECPEDFINKNGKLRLGNSFFLHFYNEMWVRKNINKNAIFDESSIFESVANKFGIL